MEEQNDIVEKLEAKILIDELNYQDSSIVSKQILKKPNGNISFFAFGKSESLTEHSSPFEAVVYMVDGTMNITIGGKLFEVEAGELLIMPANIPHGLQAKTDCKMLLTMIK